MALLALPWTFVGTGLWYSWNLLRLTLEAPAPIHTIAPVLPGAAGIPRRLLWALSPPVVQTDAARPEKALLEYHERRRAAWLGILASAFGAIIFWILGTAALVGWFALGWRRWQEFSSLTRP